MINQNLFKKIQEDLQGFQAEREVIIGNSRQILQSSKKAIFAGHQGEIKKAEDYLKEAEHAIDELLSKYQQDNRLRFEGSYKAGLEEYVEAKFFIMILNNQAIDVLDNPTIGAEEYLGGLCDVTGELVRRAVLLVTKDQFDDIVRFKEVTEEIISFMLGLYMTGYMRQKFDDAKRNLQRLEQILYDLKIKKGV
jgi:predicted translin family RNA/ssDNA-binding protein